MVGKFNFEELTDHDLYHLKYGKGAVIVAVQREDVDSSRENWEQKQEELQLKSREQIKPIKQKILELQKMRRCTGKNDELRDHNVPIENEIQVLQKKINNLMYREKAFFTGLQVAEFYNHNLPPRSEVHTRLDKIISINEFGGHVEIDLEFYDPSVRDRIHHLKTGIYDLKHVGAIGGRVKRVVPVENLTLEIIGRNSF